MSKADEIFIQNMTDILERGFSDENLPVRPHWEDGTPAHTIKIFGVTNRYNLQEELPIMTLRRTAWKSCLDELLWIWQRKSNNIHDLKPHIWDSWASTWLVLPPRPLNSASMVRLSSSSAPVVRAVCSAPTKPRSAWASPVR